MAPRKKKAPTTTYLCFVRHGTTPTTGKLLPGTAPGLHLSDRGRAEAEAVAGRLRELGSARALYCSPVDRAYETAGVIASQIGLERITDADLADTDVGEWTGKSLAVMRRRKEWRIVVGHPSGFRFPGGESFAEVHARIAAAVERIVNKERGKVVVVVSHADPIKIALIDALGVPLDHLNRLTVGTCSTSVVAYVDGPPRVLAINSYADPTLIGVPSPDGAARPQRQVLDHDDPHAGRSRTR